jgi:hypothetical protein
LFFPLFSPSIFGPVNELKTDYMGNIKSKIGQAGLVIAVMGIASIILSIFNYNVRLLAWIDIWGETAGWIIRIALIVGGGAMFLLLKGHKEDDQA